MNQYNEFLDSWNQVLGYETPAHHSEMTKFLANVTNGDSHRGLLMAFRHSPSLYLMICILSTKFLFMCAHTYTHTEKAQTSLLLIYALGP